MEELVRICDVEDFIRDQVKHIAESKQRLTGFTDPGDKGRYQSSLEGQEKAYKVMLEEIKRMGRS